MIMVEFIYYNLWVYFLFLSVIFIMGIILYSKKRQEVSKMVRDSLFTANRINNKEKGSKEDVIYFLLLFTYLVINMWIIYELVKFDTNLRGLSLTV